MSKLALEIKQLSELVIEKPIRYARLDKPKIVKCDLKKGITRIGTGYENTSWSTQAIDYILSRDIPFMPFLNLKKDMFVDQSNQYIGFFKFPDKSSLGAINFNGRIVSYNNLSEYGTSLSRKGSTKPLLLNEDVLLAPDDTLLFEYKPTETNFSITLRRK